MPSGLSGEVDRIAPYCIFHAPISVECLVIFLLEVPFLGPLVGPFSIMPLKTVKRSHFKNIVIADVTSASLNNCNFRGALDESLKSNVWKCFFLMSDRFQSIEREREKKK